MATSEITKELAEIKSEITMIRTCLIGNELTDIGLVQSHQELKKKVEGLYRFKFKVVAYTTAYASVLGAILSIVIHYLTS